eukprot:GHVN01025778.1.p1 GENE.GHVN01025778.1~~GHVN01025778.1.p1  ORF type:complete len:106 (-),score=13.47 GHVN01025778.1:688-1005(-)
MNFYSLRLTSTARLSDLVTKEAICSPRATTLPMLSFITSATFPNSRSAILIIRSAYGRLSSDLLFSHLVPLNLASSDRPSHRLLSSPSSPERPGSDSLSQGALCD